jgi:hypothetical protein
MTSEQTARLKTLIVRVSEDLDADIFLYTGAIERAGSVMVMETVEGLKPRRRNGVLILTTAGGDADAAFIIARQFKRAYKRFYLFVFGECKSAGTLVATGADEIVMSSWGELGPLDVQVPTDDSIHRRNSGLDIFQALSNVSSQAFNVFEDTFLGVIVRSGGSITTRTAAEIASTLASELLAPIAAQIDPLRLGEMQRSINVAHKYAALLGARQEMVEKLVHDYPSHGFVVDAEEAQKLFGCVRAPSETEAEMVELLRALLDERTGGEAIRTESDVISFFHLKGVPSPNPENEDATADTALEQPGGGGEDDAAPDRHDVQAGAGHHAQDLRAPRIEQIFGANAGEDVPVAAE